MPPKTAIKSLFAHISLVVLLNLLVKPVWLLVEMQVQDTVGHEAWGTYAALLAFGFLFIALSDLGVNQYLTKSLAGQPDLFQAYVPNLLSFKLLATALYPLLIVGLGWLMGYGQQELFFLLLLCLVHGLNQVMEFFRGIVRAGQHFRLDGLLSVFDRLFLLLLTVGLFAYGLDVERFIYARLLTVALGAGLFYLVVVRLYQWIKPRLQGAVIRQVIRHSLTFALMTVLYSLHDKVDQVMLERLAGSRENGLYAGAYRWLDAFSMYLWTVLPIFFARFAYYLRDTAEQERLLHFGQVLTALPFSLVSLFVFFYGEKLFFLFDQQTTAADLATMTAALQALFVAAFLNGFFAIFSTLLTATGYERVVNRMIVLSILLNIGLNAVFIPRYGALASAWTTVASYAVIDLAYVLYIHTRLPVRVPYRQMARLFLCTGLGAAAFWGLDYLGLPWYAVTLLASLLTLGFAWAIRLLSWQQIRSFRVG